jgi:isoleucyl-tRNA synthetase
MTWSTTSKPNFRALGRRFGNRTQVLAAAITSVDPGALAAQLREAGEASVVVDGEPLVIGTAEVIVTQTPRAGWSVAADAGETVALDLGITPELRREGLAREVIRLVQDARKADGLEVSDRTWVGHRECTRGRRVAQRQAGDVGRRSV